MKKINFNIRIDRKMENLSISEKDIIKYKKLNFLRSTSITFIIIFLVMCLSFKEISPSTICAIFSALLIIYVIILGLKFKNLASNNKVYQSIYSSRFLDKFIKRNNINESNVVISSGNIHIDNKDVQCVMDLINGIEIRIASKIAIPIIIIVTIIGLILMFYKDGETIERVLQYKAFLIAPIFLISGGCGLVLIIIMTSNFKIQSKIKEKTVNKLKNYYKLGCIDYLDCAVIEKHYGYLNLNEDLDTIDYLELLNKYNFTKEQLLVKYIDLKLIEFANMLFLGLTILVYIIAFKILNLRKGATIIMCSALLEYVKKKIKVKRKKLVEEVYINTEKSSELFNKICDKDAHFKYCLSELISNKAKFNSMFQIF